MQLEPELILNMNNEKVSSTEANAHLILAGSIKMHLMVLWSAAAAAGLRQDTSASDGTELREQAG